ncbi:MAG: hypothetical protein OXT67_11805 [Zetaproteobacteria bacterium]|nr:hypothetical protein [Zetaproteobacteria bacterium]
MRPSLILCALSCLWTALPVYSNSPHVGRDPLRTVDLLTEVEPENHAHAPSKKRKRSANNDPLYRLGEDNLHTICSFLATQEEDLLSLEQVSQTWSAFIRTHAPQLFIHGDDTPAEWLSEAMSHRFAGYSPAQILKCITGIRSPQLQLQISRRLSATTLAYLIIHSEHAQVKVAASHHLEEIISNKLLDPSTYRNASYYLMPFRLLLKHILGNFTAQVRPHPDANPSDQQRYLTALLVTQAVIFSAIKRLPLECIPFAGAERQAIIQHSYNHELTHSANRLVQAAIELCRLPGEDMEDDSDSEDDDDTPPAFRAGCRALPDSFVNTMYQRLQARAAALLQHHTPHPVNATAVSLQSLYDQYLQAGQPVEHQSLYANLMWRFLHSSMLFRLARDMPLILPLIYRQAYQALPADWDHPAFADLQSYQDFINTHFGWNQGLEELLYQDLLSEIHATVEEMEL